MTQVFAKVHGHGFQKEKAVLAAAGQSFVHRQISNGVAMQPIEIILPSVLRGIALIFGLLTMATGSDASAQRNIFFPHSDGSPNRDFGIRSDFRVMEDGICRRIASYRGFDCGTNNLVD